MTTTAGNWIAVRAVANFRVWSSETGEYHRGSDGAVRVYREQVAADNRASKKNKEKSHDENH